MTLVGMSGRVGALAPARHARRVHLPKSFSPPGRGGLFSAVRSKTLKKKKMPKFWIQSSLESPKHGRMRRWRSPDPRPIPERVREPIYRRKKCAIWTRWRPVPVKNVNFSRAPGIVIAVSSDPILPHR